MTENGCCDGVVCNLSLVSVQYHLGIKSIKARHVCLFIYFMTNVFAGVYLLLNLSQSGTVLRTAVNVSTKTSSCCNCERHTCVVMCLLVQAGSITWFTLYTVAIVHFFQFSATASCCHILGRQNASIGKVDKIPPHISYILTRIHSLGRVFGLREKTLFCTNCWCINYSEVISHSSWFW